MREQHAGHVIWVRIAQGQLASVLVLEANLLRIISLLEQLVLPASLVLAVLVELVRVEVKPVKPLATDYSLQEQHAEHVITEFIALEQLVSILAIEIKY